MFIYLLKKWCIRKKARKWEEINIKCVRYFVCSIIEINGLTRFSGCNNVDHQQLMTDVGDEMCWWQLWDVGDRFKLITLQCSKESLTTVSVTSIEKLSPSYSHDHHFWFKNFKRNFFQADGLPQTSRRKPDFEKTIRTVVS